MSATARSSAEITELCESLLPTIGKLGGRTKGLYSESGQMGHYRRLTETLFDRFHDESLAIAGFLHGVVKEELPLLESYVPSEALDILRDWRQLVSLLPVGIGLDKDLSDEYLRKTYDNVDVRSAVLLVYERLDRFDPDGALRAWGKRFRHSPRPFEGLEELARREVRIVERYSQEDLHRFLEWIAAPVARALGMWQEHTVLRDAALARRDPEHFAELAQLAREQHESWALESLRYVQRKLEKNSCLQGAAEKIYWEWRHLATMAEQLAAVGGEQRADHLGRCAFITIVCEDEAACYQMLGAVHRSFEYRQEFLRDAIGNPSRSGYRAIHTAIRDSRTDKNGYLKIRITMSADEEHRFEFADADHLDTLKKEKGEWDRREIQVFYEDKPRYLAPGTTILELAAFIDRNLVPIVAGAKLHGTRVGRFHTLRSGDAVELILDKHQAFPEDWKSRVDLSSIPTITRALNQGYGHLLEKSARNWLSDELGEVVVDEVILDVLLETALSRVVGAEELEKRGVPWWKHQLGLVNRKLRNESVPYPIDIEEAQAKRIIKMAANGLKRIRSLVPIFDVEPTAIEEIERCSRCRPNRRSALVITVHGGRLVIHREGETCSQGGSPLKWKGVTLGQVFHVEMSNEPGVMREVLSLYSDRGINVLELVLRLLGPRWGAARLETEAMDQATISAIMRDLGRVKHVSKTYGPGEEVPSFIAQSFPPRVNEESWLLSKHPEPFVCGPVVREPHHFYGRKSEMHQLYRCVVEARETSSRGQHVFVSGPLKSGKTSLVQRVQTILNQDRRHPSLCVYHKTAMDETWQNLESLLLDKLLAQLAAIGYQWFSAQFRGEAQSLWEFLRKFRNRFQEIPIMLAVDEAVRLLVQTNREPRAMGALRQFNSLFQTLNGAVIVWIGPAAPVDELTPELQELLRGKAIQIPIQPLSLRETREMLKAQKLDLFHRIEVGETVARRVHQITMGDPFWISHLGYRMWRLATASRLSKGRIRFKKKIVRQAADQLMQYSIPFKGRLFPSGTKKPRERKLQMMLFALAEIGRKPLGRAPDTDAPDTGMPGATTREILFYLEQKDVEIPRETAYPLLYEMMARGGVVVDSAGKWQFAAPLVRLFIEYQIELVGWESLQTMENET